MPPVLDAEATNRARAAIIQLLEDRPHLRDTKNNQVQDLISFLEIEDNSEDWLPPFLSNTRSLANLWRTVVKEGEAVPPAEVTPPPALPPTPKAARRTASPTPRVEKTVVATPQAFSNHPSVVKPETGDIWATTQSVEGEAKAEKNQPVPTSTSPVRNVPTSEVLSGEIVEAKPFVSTASISRPVPEVQPEASLAQSSPESNGYELVKPNAGISQAGAATASERALQASRALAEQFAIVQYHEQMLEQVSRSVEELTEALSQARQRQADATHAYSSSLEELARLMATSLGPRAGEFGKLFSRVVSTGGNVVGSSSSQSKGR